jgi:hypothetical protein
MHETEPLIHAIQRQSAEEILVNPRMSKGPASCMSRLPNRVSTGVKQPDWLICQHLGSSTIANVNI